MKFRFTGHALEKLEQRALDRGLIERVLESPGQVLEQRQGRRVLQSRVHFPDGEYLLRVIVDGRTKPPAVVTVYRTRYLAKYWRQE